MCVYIMLTMKSTSWDVSWKFYIISYNVVLLNCQIKTDLLNWTIRNKVASVKEIINKKSSTWYLCCMKVKRRIFLNKRVWDSFSSPLCLDSRKWYPVVSDVNYCILRGALFQLLENVGRWRELAIHFICHLNRLI